jgi:transcriptional regulator with XRE-family HTH domain
MDLLLYMRSRNFTQEEFAAMIHVKPSTISNYIHGRRKPTLEIGRRIEKFTKGKVTIEDLLAYQVKND